MTIVKSTDNLPDELCTPPGFLGELVTHMNSTAEYSLPEFFLAAALSLLSVITGRKIQDYRGTRTNLFCVSVGPSGCGKDHSRKINRNILKNTHLEGPEKFTSGSAIVTSLETSESLLCQVDEIGMYLKAACSERAPAHLQQVISTLMTAFTSADSLWKPTGFADMKNTKSVDQPHIVVHGTTTNAAFFDGLSGSEVASGFLGRLLIFLSPKGTYVDDKEFEIRPIPKSITNFVDFWLKLSCGEAGFSPNPSILKINDDAKFRLKEHFGAIAKQRIGEHEVDAAIWSRTSEKSSKLALLAACSRSSDVIELQDADWSIAVANFLTRRMIALVKGNVASSEFERKVQRLLRVIKDEGNVITQRDFSRRTQWLPAKERNDIVLQLKEAGSLFDGVRNTKGREASCIALSLADLEKQGWTALTEEMVKAAIEKKKEEAQKLRKELSKLSP